MFSFCSVLRAAAAAAAAVYDIQNQKKKENICARSLFSPWCKRRTTNIYTERKTYIVQWTNKTTQSNNNEFQKCVLDFEHVLPLCTHIHPSTHSLLIDLIIKRRKKMHRTDLLCWFFLFFGCILHPAVRYGFSGNDIFLRLQRIFLQRSGKKCSV